MKLKASVETFFLDHESLSLSCSIDLLAAAAAQEEKKTSDESEKKSEMLTNTQFTSSKTNDSFSKSKKINSKNLNIAAMKKRIIAKLKASNKSLMKQLLVKIKSQINKRKAADSFDNSSNLSFTMISREKKQTTHTRSQKKSRISRNSTTKRESSAIKRRKVSDDFDSKNCQEKRQAQNVNNNNNNDDEKVNKKANNNDSNDITFEVDNFFSSTHSNFVFDFKSSLSFDSSSVVINNSLLTGISIFTDEFDSTFYRNHTSKHSNKLTVTQYR